MDNSMLAEINRFRQMTVSQLRVEWERLYGEPTRSRNKTYLWRRLAWRVQELAYGGLSEAAKERMIALSPTAFVRSQLPAGFHPEVGRSRTPPGNSRAGRDPRLPAPGTTIVREYRGQQLRLQVLDDGFELDGVHCDSLSEAARVVTGQRWNGPLFWGLRERKRNR